MDHLYAYLKGRSDGAITRAKVEADASELQRACIAGALRAGSRGCRWRGRRAAAGDAPASARRCASARIRTTCRSPTPRAKASRTGSPSCSARRSACRSTYYSFPQRLAFIRNTLRYKLPGRGLSLRHRDGRAGRLRPGVGRPSPTTARPTRWCSRKGKGLDQVRTARRLSGARPRPSWPSCASASTTARPASEWLGKHGLVDSGVPYQIMNADPDQYPGEIIEKDLAGGKLDAAIVWGPIAGYFAKRVQDARAVGRAAEVRAGGQFDYQMAMGVRYGEREWKQQVEGADRIAAGRDPGHPAGVRRAAARECGRKLQALTAQCPIACAVPHWPVPSPGRAP